jgi:hypothetical protein
MPVERRLRGGLERNAGVVDPDVERFLAIVVRRARPRVIMRRAAAGLAVAAALATALVAGPPVLHVIQSAHRDVPAAHPSRTPGVTPLSGTFTRTVAPGTTAITVNHMAGSWTIRLGGEAIQAVSAPPGFTGVLSTFQFQVRGSMFRTNLFIQDVCANKPAGTYRWAVSDRILRFTAVSDPCQARVAFFTSGQWQEIS